jgi:2-pyrone-4,6-dicarboxylate lactonase
VKFEKTPGWLDWYANPAKPCVQVPPGSVDAHCHVFGPGNAFPLRPGAQVHAVRRVEGTALCVARSPGLRAQRRRAGDVSRRGQQCDGRRGEVEQRPCPGHCYRPPGFTEAQLRELHDAGVRGVRFNFVKRLVDFTPKDELNEIAGRIQKLGWHVVIYFEAVDLPELWDFFTGLPTTIVVDHMGRPDVTKPIDGPEFELFVKFMRDNRNVWSKVSCPERLSVSGPPALDGERNAYRDVQPFAQRIVETFPDRVLWGTDWPHPNLKNHMPDDGLLVDFIPHVAPTPELQRKLLVDNPMRLYWPEEV